MPPKVKVTKEEIVRAATALVRKYGEEALGARALAAELCCSTQPIFSNFTSMEELRLAVIDEAERIGEEYIKKETESGKYPPYKASGMAYIRFAGEEKELFRLLYMRNRSDEVIPEETDLGNRMEGMVQSQTGLKSDEAKLFHLEMWAAVHGIAVMLATGFLELDEALIARMLTDIYQALKEKAETEAKNVRD